MPTPTPPPPHRRKADTDALRELCDPARSLFEVLGARPSSTPRELATHRRLATAMAHPDRWAGADAPTLKLATDAMARVNLAYETLTSVDARRRYFLVEFPKTHDRCVTCDATGEVVTKRRGFTATSVSECPVCFGAAYLSKPKKEP